MFWHDLKTIFWIPWNCVQRLLLENWTSFSNENNSNSIRTVYSYIRNDETFEDILLKVFDTFVFTYNDLAYEWRLGQLFF